MLDEPLSIEITELFGANKRLMDSGVAPNKKCYETSNNLVDYCPDCAERESSKIMRPLDVHEYKTVNSKGENCLGLN